MLEWTKRTLDTRINNKMHGQTRRDRRGSKGGNSPRVHSPARRPRLRSRLGSLRLKTHNILRRGAPVLRAGMRRRLRLCRRLRSALPLLPLRRVQVRVLAHRRFLRLHSLRRQVRDEAAPGAEGGAEGGRGAARARMLSARIPVPWLGRKMLEVLRMQLMRRVMTVQQVQQ